MPCVFCNKDFSVRILAKNLQSTFRSRSRVTVRTYFKIARSYAYRTNQTLAIIFSFYGMLLSLTVSEKQNRRVDSAFHGQSHLVNTAPIVSERSNQIVSDFFSHMVYNPMFDYLSVVFG